MQIKTVLYMKVIKLATEMLHFLWQALFYPIVLAWVF